MATSDTKYVSEAFRGNRSHVFQKQTSTHVNSLLTEHLQTNTSAGIICKSVKDKCLIQIVNFTTHKNTHMVTTTKV